MNCIPGREFGVIASIPALTKIVRLSAIVCLLLLAGGCALAAEENSEERVYTVHYTLRPLPADGNAEVRLELSQDKRLLRQLSMDAPAELFSNFEGDGVISRDGDTLTWTPPRDGGVLSWTVKVRHLRYGQSYDAWMGEDWALLRASDVIPPARTRALKGARSRTTLAFTLPSGWSSVTRYRERNGRYTITNQDRRFDRPTGWILLGKIGVRFETIAGVRVLIAGPTGQNVRRMDMLALLQWTLPQVKGVLPDYPGRLTVISAGDHMWRGGLSGPSSLYIHSSLPLISENATSTLLHEVMHIGMGLSAEPGADWIIEGLAEYYSLELLRRSRTISKKRFDGALEDLAEWGSKVTTLCERQSTADTTAHAVGVFAALHRELRRTGRKDPLDELLQSLVKAGNKVSVAGLLDAASKLHGSTPDALSGSTLRGCDR